MPTQNHGATLARQWELLKAIPPRQPGKEARKLRDTLEAEGHNVSKRTVERDLIELSRIFPLVQNNTKTVPTGWHWMENARFDILGIDLSEAVSLGLMEDILRQIVPPTFTVALEGKFMRARDKLTAIPKNPFSKWTDLVRYVPPGLPFLPPAIAADVLPAVQEALLQRHQLKVVYSSADSDESKELTLHPLALIQQGARSYLLATAFHYGEPLLYALHRMASAELLDQPSIRPADFSLDTYLAQGGAQFGTGKTITLQARVSDGLARLLAETPLSADQKITTRSGIHTLTATLPDSWQLNFWILSQGPAITVLKPTSLRKSVIDSHQSALANYTGE